MPVSGQRFKSKVDWWILLLLLAAVVGIVFSLGAIVLHESASWPMLAMVAIHVSGIGLILSVLMRTWYAVEDGILKIACGPFTWRVPVDTIESVEPSHNPLSSPALSLDRLSLRIRNGGRFLVSPVHRRGFLEAIGHAPGPDDSGKRERQQDED